MLISVRKRILVGARIPPCRTSPCIEAGIPILIIRPMTEKSGRRENRGLSLVRWITKRPLKRTQKPIRAPNEREATAAPATLAEEMVLPRI